ncbi:MAG: redoxin domain-containing protein [Alistipes sp.]|nr:redoxin domain-containing protein [Candidatus Alistipes equi]
MIRRLTLILFCSLALLCCKKPSCVIDVEISSVEDSTCQVVDILQKDEVIDTVNIIRGRCTVNLFERRPSLVALRSQGEDIVLCFTDAERITVKGDALKQNLSLKGSSTNEVFTNLRWEIRDVSNYIHQSSSTEESMDAHSCYSEIMHRYFQQNRHNLLGAYLLTLFGSEFCLPSQVVSLIDSLPVEVRELESLRQCRKNAMKKASLESLSGNVYEDFSATGRDGQDVRLSDLVNNQKNKYVLLYFWTTWEDDSFEGLRKIGKLYSKLRRNGVELFAVSCERRSDKWIEALDVLCANWVNVNAYLNSRSKQCLEKYCVDTCPVYVLIDTSQGAIVSSSFSRDDIFAFISDFVK